MPGLKSVEAEITIDAPKERVWEVWSAFANVCDYIAAVPKSYLTTNGDIGLGSERRCDISAKQVVDERITEWTPGESYAIELTEARGVPVDTINARCRVAPDGDRTRAAVHMEYRMKGLLALLPVRGAMQKQAIDHLIGLKHHIETGETVTGETIGALRKRYGASVR